MIVRGDGPYPWSSFFIGSICLSGRIQVYGLIKVAFLDGGFRLCLGGLFVLLPGGGESGLGVCVFFVLFFLL